MAKVARIQLPDGRVARVEVPDDTTPEQAQQYAEQFAGGSDPTQAPGGGSLPPSTPYRSTMDQVGRQLGLTARAGVTGLLGIPMTIADGVAAIAKKVAPGTYGQQPLPSQGFQQELTNLGLPTPEGTAEHLAGFGASMMAGAALPVPTGGRAPVAVDPRMQAIQRAQEQGYRVPPNEAHSGLLGRTLEAVSGKQTVERMMQERNARVTDQLARRALGLPDDAPLRPDTINGLIDDTYRQGYEPIRQIGQIPSMPGYRQALRDIQQRWGGVSRSYPGAARNEVGELVAGFRVQQHDTADALLAIRQLREQADDAFRQGNSQLGHAARDISRALEDNIEEFLTAQQRSGTLHGVQQGNRIVPMTAQEILQGFREARTELAKQYTVRDAILPETGSVDAMKLAAKMAKDMKRSGTTALTDELRDIASFASVAPGVAKYPKTAAPLFTGTEGILGLGSGMGGFMSGNPYAMAATSIPLARMGIRQGLMTDVGQTLFARPRAATGPAPEWPGAIGGAYALGSGLYGQ